MARLSASALAVGVMLAGLGVVTAYQHLRIEEVAASLSSGQNVAPLNKRLDELTSQVEQLQEAGFLSRSDWQASQKPANERLEALQLQVRQFSDQQAQLQGWRDELTVLAAKVDSLQSTLQTLRQKASSIPVKNRSKSQNRPQSTARPAPHPVTAPPPFQVVGIEHRGGEAFLAVLPPQGQQLRDIDLVRPGEAIQGWRLSALGARTAQFTLPDGRTHSLTVQ
ncbi:hypothetical protein [Azotobacter salinestris]|uniref:hypothetical protein n=1 Tax=Azotobacter salinestris TaxID=69964 RepID=UPI0032E03984